MTKSGQQLCLAILLGLLVGHASVVLHTAAHPGQDAGDCEICMSYGDLPDALADQPADEPSLAESVRAVAYSKSRTPRSEALAVRPRGPPASG